MSRRSTVLVALAVALAGLVVGVVVNVVDDEPTTPAAAPTTAAGTCADTDPLVALTVLEGSRVRIDVLRPDGTREQATPPDWSALQPDVHGDRIVVARTTGETTVTSRIWTIGLDGSDPQAVTEGGDDSSPRWSPDGATIAFTRVDAEQEGTAVATVPADGGAVQDVVPVEPGVTVLSPAWSPDGSRLAYLRRTPTADDPLGGGTIWTVAADGSDPVEVGPAPEDSIGLDWHPGGSRLLVSSSAIDDGSLSVVDLATGATSVLARGAIAGRWSRDGTHVVHETKVGTIETPTWNLVERPFDASSPSGPTLGPTRPLGVETPDGPTPLHIAVAPCDP